MSDILLLIVSLIWPILVSYGVLIYVSRMKKRIEVRLNLADQLRDMHSNHQDRFEREVHTNIRTLLEDLAKRRNARAKELSEMARQRKEAQKLANAIINPS